MRLPFRILVVPMLLALLALGCSGGGGDSPTDPVDPGNSNHNPTVSINVSTTHLGYNGQATVSVTASDPDGDQLTYAYTATAGNVASSGPTATTATYTAGTSWGPATVTVTVSDGRGGTTAATASMYIRNPNPPAITLAAIAPVCTGDNDHFGVQVTTNERVFLTSSSVGPYEACAVSSKSISPPLEVPANTPTKITWQQCVYRKCSGDTPVNFEVYIWGTRPEPDGGSWAYHTISWHP